ncbi:hypothetical protein PF003_g10800 [Phytophthora fragariae]|nr:hypothetical protein PF003_g10800 [Phytophthora fragariae]
MGRKFLLSLTVLKKTCACGTLSSLDGEVSGRACSYKYGPVLDLNGASRSRRSSLPWNWAWAQRTGWRLGLGRRRAGINSQWFRGSTRSGGRRPLPSGRNFTVGFTSRVAHCAAPAAHAVERSPPPFYLGLSMRDFPPKARGPVLLALGGLRLCPDSGLRAARRARRQIGKCSTARWTATLFDGTTLHLYKLSTSTCRNRTQSVCRLAQRMDRFPWAIFVQISCLKIRVQTSYSPQATCCLNV